VIGGPGGDGYPDRVPPQPHLVLVGMMGAGKSSVGRRIARRTGRRCIDLDQQIEQAAGRTIPEIFAAEGEAAFRALETATLRTVLGADEPAVVAVGGGAVLPSENRRLMRDRAFVVWLRATPETLLERVGDGRGRPLLADDPGEVITRLVTERADAYLDAAHEIVDVDRLPFDTITERVLAAAGLEVAS
jgi:shikimate kinase